MPITKKQSIQDESFFLQEPCFLIICLKNDWFYDSAYMDQDKINDLLDGQLGHNFGI